MNKYLILAALLIGFGITYAQTTQKTAYVDSRTIFAQLPEAIKAQGDLEALAKSWYDKIDSMKVELQKSYEDYQKQEKTMKEDKKKIAQQSLITKEQSIQEFQRAKFTQGTGELYQKQAELLDPIKTKVLNTISDVAKSEGYTFVFDKSDEIVLLYADSAFDITYKVLDKLKTGTK